MTKMLTFGNPKTEKSLKYGYSTAIMHLTPHKLGNKTTCPKASKGCIAACLNVSGAKYRQDAKDKARAFRTKSMFKNRAEFWANVLHESKLHAGRCNRKGTLPASRLRGTHDMRPPKKVLNALKSMGIKSYDYTKNWEEKPTKDYHLTFSRTENHSLDHIKAKIKTGSNVAVVFRDKIPMVWEGMQVIDGTLHDLRFLDPKGVIVGLRALARAKKDKTGFVVDAPEGVLYYQKGC